MRLLLSMADVNIQELKVNSIALSKTMHPILFLPLAPFPAQAPALLLPVLIQS